MKKIITNIFFIYMLTSITFTSFCAYKLDEDLKSAQEAERVLQDEFQFPSFEEYQKDMATLAGVAIDQRFADEEDYYDSLRSILAEFAPVKGIPKAKKYKECRFHKEFIKELQAWARKHIPNEQDTLYLIDSTLQSFPQTVCSLINDYIDTTKMSLDRVYDHSDDPQKSTNLYQFPQEPKGHPTIWLKTLTGKVFRYEIKPKGTFLNIKEYIAQEMGVDIHKVRFVLAGREIHTPEALMQRNIVIREGMMHVVLRMRPRSRPESLKKEDQKRAIALQAERKSRKSRERKSRKSRERKSRKSRERKKRKSRERKKSSTSS